MRILLTGGGTGGHAVPIIAVIYELKQRGDNLSFFWLGASSFEKNAASENKIPFFQIVSGKFRRYFSLLNFIDFFKVPIGIFQSFFLILGFKPDVVFSKGGSVSFPVVFAAYLLRKKIILHESDFIPGLANRVMFRFARKVLLGFKSPSLSKDQKYLFVGNPIRREILQCQSSSSKKHSDLKPQKPILFILGGSQGSEFINHLTFKAIPSLGRYEIIHLTGKQKNHFESKKYSNYHQSEFFSTSQMAKVYSRAALIISRAGANTLSEIAACGLPSILIPLPSSAGGHQALNAEVFAKAGASLVLDQNTLNAKKFIKIINNLFADQSKLRKMSVKAKTLSTPNAAEKIAAEILGNKKSE